MSTLLEFKRYLFVCQFAIYRCKGSRSGLNFGLVLGVEVYLEDSASIDFASSSLSLDLGGENNVIQNGILDSCESATSRPDTLGSVISRKGLPENGALANHNHVAATELLFELARELDLNRLKGFQEFVGDV